MDIFFQIVNIPWITGQPENLGRRDNCLVLKKLFIMNTDFSMKTAITDLITCVKCFQVRAKLLGNIF